MAEKKKDNQNAPDAQAAGPAQAKDPEAILAMLGLAMVKDEDEPSEAADETTPQSTDAEGQAEPTADADAGEQLAGPVGEAQADAEPEPAAASEEPTVADGTEPDAEQQDLSHAAMIEEMRRMDEQEQSASADGQPPEAHEAGQDVGEDAEPAAAGEEMPNQDADAAAAASMAAALGPEEAPAEEEMSNKQDDDAAAAAMLAAMGLSDVDDLDEEEDSEQSPASAEPPAAEQTMAAAAGVQPGPVVVAAGKHASLVQIMVLANSVLILLVVCGLVWLLLSRGGGMQQPTAASASMAPPATTRPAAQPEEEAGSSTAAQAEELVVASPSEPASWKRAESCFAERKYAEALRHYRGLQEASPRTSANAMIFDLLELRSSQCLAALGRVDQAAGLSEKLTSSESPVVRGMAWFALAEKDFGGGQFLQARAKAFRALADLASMNKELPLVVDCDYLVARSLTEKVMSYYNLGEELPWGKLTVEDPFAGLSEGEIGKLLEDGAHREDSVLGPKIRRLPKPGRLSAAAAASALEEVLGAFAAETGQDVKWSDVKPAVRQRLVTVSLPDISEQRLAEIVCGGSRLIARFTGNEVVVADPDGAVGADALRKMLAQEAVSTWRRFFLRHREDPRLSYGSFALASIQEAMGDRLGAMQQFRATAHAYPRKEVAPLALLRCAKQRIAMLDFAGARTDLLDILDRFPDCDRYEEVYLSLGQATQQAGLYDEAIRVFQKLYVLNLSAESRSLASLGAAECLFATGRHEESRKWVHRYLGLASKKRSERLCGAFLTLARAEQALGRPGEAARAYYHALGAKPSAGQKVEALLGLAQSQVERRQYVRAIGTLNQLERLKLGQEQQFEYLMRASALLRSMGLSHRGYQFLRERIDRVADGSLRAQLGLEMARCLRDGGEAKPAQEMLTEVLPYLPAGQLFQEASCELAEMLLEESKADQAIAILNDIVRQECSADVRKRAMDLLGDAHLQQKSYEQAAQAYSGMLRTGVEAP